ncbi:hypothetical protein MNBD_GAMMA09-1614 [hydrothermal vent metagenome]|uniref:HTH marR-type domain-containing protein n=1 Tax=hydrothermal vent metagenome TaxID=652676 RepID=A0A3B0Y7Y1_9ZZZZ
MFEKCIYFNANALVRQINKIWDEAFKPYGLSPAHAYVLRVVLDQPGISMSEIADTLELAPSTVTRFVDSLINKDLLTRISSNNDRRSTQVHPTKRSKKIHLQLEQTGQSLYLKMNKLIGKAAFTDLVEDMRNTRKQL